MAIGIVVRGFLIRNKSRDKTMSEEKQSKTHGAVISGSVDCHISDSMVVGDFDKGLEISNSTKSTIQRVSCFSTQADISRYLEKYLDDIYQVIDDERINQENKNNLIKKSKEIEKCMQDGDPEKASSYIRNINYIFATIISGINHSKSEFKPIYNIIEKGSTLIKGILELKDIVL